MAGQIVFALVFGSAGAMLLFVGIAIFVKTRRFAADAVRTSGTVVENTPDGVGQNAPCYPMFEFTDWQGIHRRVRGSTASHPPRFAIGAGVTVLYSRDDPESAAINSFGDLWLLPVLASTLGVVLVLMPVYVWVQDAPVSLSVMGFTIPGSTQVKKADSQLQVLGRTAPPSAASKPSIGEGPIAITAAEPRLATIGEPITLRGSNFGRAEDHRVSIGGHGMSVDLQVIEWNTDAVTVKIPDDPRILQDRSYYYRIHRMARDKRGNLSYDESSNLFMFRFKTGNEFQPVIPPGAAVGSGKAAGEWIAVDSRGDSTGYDLPPASRTILK